MYGALIISQFSKIVYVHFSNNRLSTSLFPTSLSYLRGPSSGPGSDCAACRRRANGAGAMLWLRNIINPTWLKHKVEKWGLGAGGGDSEAERDGAGEGQAPDHGRVALHD